ncbi:MULTISPECIES: hypothetical protein [unclassified Synechocystis]|uniref:hypothetical protein n=1 Tax=unclassified Synechocystis TaxID=2640012 RepID=UPI000A59DF6A|nr:MULTISPECIES: hypothetical protein [unclassified Synechocystis]
MLTRYNLKTRQSLYNRINALGLEPTRKGNKVLFGDEAVKLLDQLDEHLAEGGTLNNFVPPSEVTTVGSSIESVAVDSDLLPFDPGMVALIQLMESRRSPLDNLRDLEDAVSYGWLLTTTQIEKLLGVKPRGEQFDRQGFLFTRQGKAGREAQWSITKITRGLRSVEIE